MNNSTSSNLIKEYRCQDLRGRFGSMDDIDDRQRRVPGFDQDVASTIKIACIGCGGLGGHFSQGATKKGYGSITLFDGDDAEPSNLNRQIFTPPDIGKNKAECGGRIISEAGYLGTRIFSVPYYFQAAVDHGLVSRFDVVHCGVDNSETRTFVSPYLRDIPVIFTAVSEDAGHGHVIVQEPGKACLGCILPQEFEPNTAVSREDGACPKDPAIIDVVAVVAMVALYALDSLFMDRPRNWNFKQIALHGQFPEINANVQRRQDCPVCGKWKT